MPASVTEAIDAWRRRGSEPITTVDPEEAEWLEAAAEARLRYGAVTARSAGLYACPSCGLLSTQVDRETADEPASEPLLSPPPPITSQEMENAEPATVECPRCGESLHVRKPGSITKTWAYLISAFILYIPANVLPITDTRTLFDEESDTIFSGVVHLWQAGSWPLALLVFFASITVPVAKLIVLTGLTLSVQRGSLRKPGQRTRLYRIVEFIGRWSMLDIFAVAILTALVQLKSLAQVTAGPAVLAFGAVCVLTILASHAFDPRLIWDPIDASGSDPDLDDD
jgi:paraquat-inducible protein A